MLNTAPVYEPLAGFERYAHPSPHGHADALRPEGNIRCSCYSPDGRFLAYASTERSVPPLDTMASLTLAGLLSWMRPSAT